MRGSSTWLKDNGIIIFFGLLLEVFFLMYHPQVPLEPLIASSPWLIRFGETFPLFAAFAPYFFSFLESRRTGRTDPRLVIGFAVLFALTLIAAVLPTLSADVGGYAFYGKLLPGYGADPYGSISQNFPAEPFSTSGTWTRWLNPYGPLWTIIATFVMTAVQGNFYFGVVIFKILATLAFFGSAFLLLALRGRISGATGKSGGWATEFLLLFLWNPYALFEAAHEGHNDFILIFFLAAAVWLFARGRHALSAVAFAASVFTKYVTVLLLPIFLIAAFKKAGQDRKSGPAAAGSFLLIFLTVGIVAAAPFWRSGLFNGLRNQLALIHNSGYYGLFPFFIDAGLRAVGFYPVPAAELTHGACTVLFAAVFAVICLVYLWRRSSGVDVLIKTCFYSLAAYLLIDSFWFMPWYFLWLAPLAFVTEGYGTFLILTLCGLTATGTYVGPVVSWVLLGIIFHAALRPKEQKSWRSNWKRTWERFSGGFLGH